MAIGRVGVGCGVCARSDEPSVGLQPRPAAIGGLDARVACVRTGRGRLPHAHHGHEMTTGRGHGGWRGKRVVCTARPAGLRREEKLLVRPTAISAVKFADLVAGPRPVNNI